MMVSRVTREREERRETLGRSYQEFFRLGPFLTRYAVVSAMVATFVAFSIFRADSFFTVLTLKAIPRDMAPLLIMALGATVVLAMREFDLSIGGMLGLCGTFVVIMVSTEYFGLPIPLAIPVALIFGICLGLVNGVLVAYAGGSSFIVTIAFGTLYNGVDLQVLGSTTIFEGIPDLYIEIAGGTLLGLSNQAIIGLCALVFVYILLEWTEYGRQMYAIGGNLEAARLSGIRVRLLQTLGFGTVGLCAAVAGLVISSQAGAANPNSGLGILLPAYAAAFLGSTMWQPGVFTAMGTLLGAVFLQIIGTGLSLFNLGGAIVYIIQGAILAVAVLLSRLGGRQ